jgi:probable HAF family extracellular repeat protein
VTFFSFATDISSKGQAVGFSCDENEDCHAFLWQNGMMMDVNTLIPASSDLQLVTAFQINSRGQINGTAIQKSTGQTRAYLATPTNGVPPT